MVYGNSGLLVKSQDEVDCDSTVSIGISVDREPCHLATSRAFLRSIWDFDHAPDFESFYLFPIEDDGAYLQRIRPRDYNDLDSLLKESYNRPRDWYWSPQSYCPGRRTDDRICQINALVIDLDCPQLDEALDALARVSVQPHYVVQTSIDRYQLVLKLDPIRVGKGSRQRVLDRFRTVARRLAEIAGGDLNAAKPGQAFRIPGSRRITPDGILTVTIIEQSDHTPYDLRDLVSRVKAPKRVSSFLRSERTSNQVGTVLKSPPLEWVAEQRIAEGSRNKAIVARAYSYYHYGKSDEAPDAIADWAISHLDGFYPRRKVLSDVAACLRNPKGLSPEILATIENVQGETMSLSVARSVFKYMPKSRQRHERKPINELRNRPLFERVGQVLQVLQALQTQNASRPVLISAEALSQKANVPLGTFNCRVLPVLESFNIHSHRGRGHLGTYDLRQAQFNIHKDYAFIELGMFVRRIERVVRYWQWRFSDAWHAFKRLITQIVSAFQAKLETVDADDYRTSQSELDRPQLRGPPFQLRPIPAVSGPQTSILALSLGKVCP